MVRCANLSFNFGNFQYSATQKYCGTSIQHIRSIFRKINLSYPLIRTLMCAYQGVRNVSFLENFTQVLRQ